MRYFRHPKTTQERREAEYSEIPVRPKRNNKNLANEYDDVTHSEQRSWKRQSKKRKQWERA